MVEGRGHCRLIQPSIIEYYGQSNGQRGDRTTIDHTVEPEARLRETDAGQVLRPEPQRRRGRAPAGPHDEGQIRPGRSVLVELNHGTSAKGPKDDDRRSHSVDQPLGSLTTKRGIGLAQPILIQTGQQTGQAGENGSCAQPPEQPVPTLTPTVKPAVPHPQLRRTRRAGAAQP